MKSAVEILKRFKRAADAAWQRMKMRCEAAKAYRYDRKRFFANAGALHPGRRDAAIAGIVMAYHVIEKGLTMPRRRLGFGAGAVRNLVRLVTGYERKFGDGAWQVEHAARVLKAYRVMHADWPEPMPVLDAFLASHPGLEPACEPHVTREEFFAKKDAPFAQFAASRHVCRHFAAPAPRETLERALAIAATAPSACNRQHACARLVEDRAVMERLFELQRGTRGFGGDAGAVFVVVSKLDAIRWAWERHDVYVNGGIYALNLCYALHHLGVAHCILHWSVPPSVDRAARKLLSLPDGEEIVCLVACGLPPPEFDIAASPRRG